MGPKTWSEVSLQTDDVTVAGTHLNVCAILSKLDKHDKAGGLGPLGEPTGNRDCMGIFGVCLKFVLYITKNHASCQTVVIHYPVVRELRR